MSLHLPSTPLTPFNVLAFDPGGTTGWAQAFLPGPIKDVELSDIIISTGEFGPEPHHQELYDFITEQRNSGFQLGVLEQKDPVYEEADLEIVYEPFHFRQHLGEQGGKMHGPRHKVELISCEYIGVIRLACAQLGLTYYDRFVPGEAKTYVPDKKLELLGWLQEPRTPMRHRNDALRQLVKYLIVKRGVRHPLTTAWRI